MRPTHHPAPHHSSNGSSPAGARTRLTRAMVAAVLAASAAGCGNAVERVTERAVEEVVERASDGDASIDIDVDTGQVTFEDDEGTTVTQGTSTEMPPEIAAAFDVPAGLTVTVVVRGAEADGGDDSIAATGTYAGATVEDLTGQLDSALIAAGWEMRDRPDTPNAYAVSGLADRGQETLGFQIISSPDVDADGPYNLLISLYPNGL